MNIQIAIVEDSNEYANQLEAYCKRYMEEKGCACTIVKFMDGIDILDQYRSNYDLIFMDIEMKHLDGMKTAEAIRKVDEEVVLIFVTNLAQYAVKGYEVNAYDFIVKPLSYEEFVFKMRKVLLHIETNQAKDILLPFAGGAYQISSKRLLYVEVQGHKLYYHLTDEVVEVRGNITDVEKNLKQWHFIRSNNCYLVNPRYVDWVKGNEMKVGNDILQISRNRKKQMMQELSEWVQRGM